MCRVRVLRSTVVCVVTLRVLRLAHASLVVSQGGYVCGYAKRMCHAGARAARSQCAYAVVHVVTLLLFARGDKCASESLGRAQQLLHPNPKGRHAATAGRSHMHPHTTRLSPTDLPGGRPAEDPGAPLLCAVRVSPSSQQPPGSGAAKSTLKLRGYPARMEKLLAADVKNYMQQNPSTWRAPRNSENAAKTAQIRNLVEIGKNNHRRELLEDKIPGTKDTRDGPGPTPQPDPGEPRDPAREPRAGTPTGKQGTTPRGTTTKNRRRKRSNTATSTTETTHTKKPQQGKNRTTRPKRRRAENREDVHVRNPRAPRKNNCVSHRRMPTYVQPVGATAQHWCSQPLS